MEKRPLILKKWSDIILDSYPAETADFLKNQANRFANPVGNTITEALEGIFGHILEKTEPDRFSTLLDSIIRIRAVQDFGPSQALAFIPALRKIIREVIGKELNANSLSDELNALDYYIDDLSLAAFDIYMKCREKIYELKANEQKRQSFRLLQKANLICEAEEHGAASELREEAL